MDIKKLAQTYLFVDNKEAYFVSTINRRSSASSCPMQYSETLVWEWDSKTRERGELIAMHRGARNSLSTHFRVIEELRQRSELKELKMPTTHEICPYDDTVACKEAAVAKLLEWLENSNGYALISDDNGHWACVYDGMQLCPTGEEPEDISTSFFIEATDWKPSIREAIIAAMEREDE